MRLDPIGVRLEAGQIVSSEEIEKLAGKPEIRFMLFAMLRQMDPPDLLPSAYISSIAEGESSLAYWMMHPNEFGDAPDKIEFLETLRRTAQGGHEVEFHVYRFRMADGHWAAKDGWQLGLAGPMRAGIEPYSEMPGAFARVGDAAGKVQPIELVDWYVEMLGQKGLNLDAYARNHS